VDELLSNLPLPAEPGEFGRGRLAERRGIGAKPHAGNGEVARRGPTPASVPSGIRSACKSAPDGSGPTTSLALSAEQQRYPLAAAAKWLMGRHRRGDTVAAPGRQPP
jgi:hypothetical protein